MTTWSSHLDRAPPSVAPRPKRSRRFAVANAQELAGDAEALYEWIREATLEGWHARLNEVDREDARLLFSFTHPQYSPEETSAAFQSACESVGPHLIYGVVVLTYVSIVNELDARGADVTGYRDQLRACLAHPVSAEPRQVPWSIRSIAAPPSSTAPAPGTAAG